MRITSKCLSQWKEAATVMLLARNRPASKPPVLPGETTKGQITHFNYKVLMLERSSKSKFMPSAFVFPGGLAGRGDSADEWCSVFDKAGIKDLKTTLPKVTQPASERAPMFLKDLGTSIPADIAYRITSIRECFEEAGILLFKKADDLNSSKFDFNKDDINSWRAIVTKDDTKFVDFCLEFNIVPDIWSLKEWNCWLTPANMPALHSGRRYDTAFYLCCLDKPPNSVHDDKEIVSSRWREPADMIRSYMVKKGWIAPPQIYELSRLCGYQKFEDISRFSDERSPQGCERWLPVRTNCDDGMVAILPDDELYPASVDVEGEHGPPSVGGTIQENLENSTNLHRFEMRDVWDVTLKASVKQKQGHCPPISLEDIKTKFPYK